MENLEIYNRVADVPKTAQREFANGRFKGTDINPMWRIKILTEVFGPCGVGFKWSEPRFWEREDGNVVTVHCKLAMQYKTAEGWSAEVWGVGGNTLRYVTRKGDTRVSDEAYKMAYTDAQSNCAKQIGVGANIWWQGEQTKYTQDKERAGVSANYVTGDVWAKIDKAKTKDELMQIWNNYPQYQEREDFKEALNVRKKEVKQ